MLCSHNSVGLGCELVHNQQGNLICLEILTCNDTSSLLLIANSGFVFCHVVVLAQVSQHCRVESIVTYMLKFSICYNDGCVAC